VKRENGLAEITRVEQKVMSKLEVKTTKLEGVRVIKPPTVFEDFRGHYVELYNEQLYCEAGLEMKFVQDDMSISTRHVLRGIHGDGVTWKLISCLMGRFYMVVINNDPESKQFRQWESFVLSEHNRFQVLIPPRFGLAHLILSEQAIFHYKQTTYYERATQFTLQWDDPELAIWWPVEKPLLSPRDSGLV
jgi:dTDP-4-dehydrorhamnose 3,5-epimerase